MKSYQARKGKSIRSQPETATYYTIPIIRHSGKGKGMKIIKTPVWARGWGGKKWIDRIQKTGETAFYHTIMVSHML